MDQINFSLGGRRTRRIWDSSVFLEEFCSHIAPVECDVGGAVTHFLGALTFVHECIGNGKIDDGIGAKVSPLIKDLMQRMEERLGLYRRIAALEQWGSDYHCSRVVIDVGHAVLSMEPGGYLLIPIRLPSGPAVFLMESTADGSDVDIHIVNPSPFTHAHRKAIMTSSNEDNASNLDESTAPLCEGSAKIVQNIAMKLSRVKRLRCSSEAFWLMVFSKVYTDDSMFYTHLLAWLTEKDFEGQVAEGLNEGAVYATPSKAAEGSGGLWKPLMHTFRHLMKTRCGLNRAETKHVRYFMREYFLPRVIAELREVNMISLTQKRMIEAAMGTLALAAARAANTMSHTRLEATRSTVEDVKRLVNNVPCKGEGASNDDQPPLNITQGWDRVQQPDIFPLFDMFRRLESVECFVGNKEEQAKATPVNFFRFPEKIETIQEAIVAFNDAAWLMVRLAAHEQKSAIKNACFLAVAAIAHFVVEVLPPPIGPITRKKHNKSTIWDTPLLYAQQVNLLERVEQMSWFFHWGYRSAAPHMNEDGVQMVVMGALAAISDNIIRTEASDLVSPITLHVNGTHPLQENGGGFSVSSGDMTKQSEMTPFTYPEALITRAAVLDYFDELIRSHPAQNVVFKFEEGSNAKEVALSKLLKQICVSESFDPGCHPDTLEFCVQEVAGSCSFICRFFPEFRHWRNSFGIMKVVMNNNGGISQSSSLLSSLGQCPDFGACGPSLRFSWGYGLDTAKGSRYASNADAGGYVNTGKDGNLTEDDLLHLQTLPSFGVLGQRDVELLLSYLTTPYLRIPLVLRFFATEDRVSALMDDCIVQLLHGVLFEPGRFLPIAVANDCPTEVPTEQPHLIATPNGLLMNELQNSPDGIIEPLLRLLVLVKEMDAGTVFNESVTQIIFVLLRLVAHVENYLHTILFKVNRDEVQREERCFVVQEKEHLYLHSSYTRIRGVIQQELLPMLDSWIEELDDAISKNELSNMDPSTASTMLCGLYQHQLLLLRNVREADYTADYISRLLSAFGFLTTRFVWGNHRYINEHELYLILQKHRRGMARWVYTHSPHEVSLVMNSVVRVSTGSGKRQVSDDDCVNYPWALVAGADCSGRFTRADSECFSKKGADNGKKELASDIAKRLSITVDTTSVASIFSGLHDVEISLQSGSLTFKAAFLKAIPQQIAQDDDVRHLFEKQLRKTRVNPDAMQCAVVEEATNRTWIQLVGLEHDIQYWKTYDARVPIPGDSMRFFPDDLEFTEKWIVKLFEPYRRAFFQRSFFQPPILILLPEDKLTEDNGVAMLTAVCSASGEKLKEIYVFKHQKIVQIYDVVSHGRRFYRRLVFVSDNIKSLNEMGDFSHGGDGTADRNCGNQTSAVILRKPTHPKNISRSVETYIPTRFLEGLLPDALLSTHTFWQDEDDNFRGYPEDRKATHVLWIHWKDMQYAPMGGKYVGVQVFRFALANAAPRASEVAVHRSERLQLADELEDEITMTRAKTTDSHGDNDDDAKLTAGMYRQSSVVHQAKPDSATIEDHNLLLVNLLFAREGTPLFSLANVISRLESLAHVLVWTAKTDYDTMAGGPLTIDLIQLPRLKLSFRAKLLPCGTTYALFSLDHAHLFISNLRPGPVLEMVAGIPHSVIMSDVNDTLTILVPRFGAVRLRNDAFSTDIFVQRHTATEWYQSVDTRYYLYPVHISQCFLFTPSFGSAAYLLFLRYLTRNYAETFRLVASVGTDEVLNNDDLLVFGSITRQKDHNPDAIACMARLSLFVAGSPHVPIPWYTPELVATHIRLQSRTSISCLLSPDEERRLTDLACSMEERVDVMKEVIRKNSGLLVGNKRRVMTQFLKQGAAAIREKLGVRISEEFRLQILYDRAQSGELHPYYRCLLFNRRDILQAEHDLINGVCADAFKTLRLKVPKLPIDPKFHLYRQYDPTSVLVDNVKPFVNDQGRTLTPAAQFDYFYCASFTRESPCRCPYTCRENCGGNNKDGCPCLSCERFNNERINTIRLLPPTLDNKMAGRPLMFPEVCGTLRQLLQQYQMREAKRKLHGEYPHSEPVSLRHPQIGFFMLYEMCTSTRPFKIGKRNSALDTVQLLLPLYTDGCKESSALSHIIHYVARCHKNQLAALPPYPKKGKTLNVSEIHAVICEMIATDAAEGLAYPLPPDESKMPKYARQEDRVNNGYRVVRFTPRANHRDASVPLGKTRILPIPLNTECNMQLLMIPDMSKLRTIGDEAMLLATNDEQLKELSEWPLPKAVPEGLVVFRTRDQLGLSLINHELQFDLSRHPDARMSVAREMLERLHHEMDTFASISNSASLPKLKGLESEAIVRSLLRREFGLDAAADKDSHGALAIKKSLQSLKTSLLDLRKEDNLFVTTAYTVLLRTANFYSSETVEGTLLLLRSVAKRESTVSFEYLLSSLCSTTCLYEWRQVNPFLTTAVCEHMKNLVAVTVLRANRVGHINRILEVINELDSFLQKVLSLAADGNGGTHLDAVVASISQKADTLASNLMVKRCYLEIPKQTVPDVFARSYDPRHLLFEFTWNLMMRKRQYELIQDIYKSIDNGESVVKQMIMGAGKTTVVSPVLGLMLANGKRLIVQVVPPALLDFTRAVLRTTFSSVLQKQIFTFTCDRTTNIDGNVTSKFEEAMRSRGIIVTTPSSVKSIFLKCIEGCKRVVDNGRKSEDREALAKESDDHMSLLNMWRDAVLVMDEVDMLLHPLKSELNFPIGPKAELDFQPMRWKLPIHLLDIVYYYHTKRLSTALRESPESAPVLQMFHETVAKGLKANALQEMPHLILLNLSFYDKELRPVLLEWLMLLLKAQHLVGLTDDETRSFLTCRPTATRNPELLAKVERLDSFHVKILNLSFEWLSSYLPHVLQKIDRVTFGIMTQREYYDNQYQGAPRSRLLTAIPFVGKDMPSPSSEFAHPDIVIGLTVLAYRYEGLRETDFHSILQEIQAAVEKEVGRFSQRRTTLLYNKWVASSGGNILTTYDYQAVRQQFNEDLEMGMQPSESLCLMEEKGMRLDYQDDSDDEDGMRRQKTAYDVPLTAAQRQVLPLKLMKQANDIEIRKLYRLFRRTPEVIHWYLCEHIFPEHMRHQELKLSASGQELGGSMLFDKRIGFSGTPSSLLPVELGQCGYEVGTDGQLIHTLTSTSIMSYSVAEHGWNVRSLLDFIANASPPFHALIDTGALITGMSNLQVAQYLLKHGLPQMEGIVYLDQDDRKMILVRATGRSLLLSECGIPKVKRFTFYDQIHTTGMDVEHTPNAQAVQTLGKDMTFRDFSQGAYRMRGIGQGQSVHILIIPEVYDLVQGAIRTVRGFDDNAAIPTDQQVLTGVTAWLLLNSIRSEHIQHNQLRLQSCSNVWRKAAFTRVVNAFDKYAPADHDSAEQQAIVEELKCCLKVFDEEVDYSVAAFVPQPRLFSDALIAHTSGKEAFLSENGASVIKSIIDSAKREDEIDAPCIDVEMVQEQEEEREREEQREQEQEVEIEKFVDLDYSREHESSIPWRFDALRSLSTAKNNFYPLREFHLFKRASLLFPDSIYLTKNYYSTAWTGYRRIKNVVCTMEWLPDSSAVARKEHPSMDYGDITPTDVALATLQKTLETLTEHQATADKQRLIDTVRAFLATALHFTPPDQEELNALATHIIDSAHGDVAELSRRVLDALSGNALRDEEHGRYTVTVSLAEAETLRRILHFKKARKLPLIDGAKTEFAIHVASCGNAQLDQSPNFVAPCNGYQRLKNLQCLRYFDGDLQYSDAEVGLLLRALHANLQGARKLFFHQTISCRRRARQRWERAPISIVFLLQSALVLLHQRTIGLCMFKDITERHQLHLGDAFVAFNSSGNGVLSADELWGAMRFCRLEKLRAEDVLDFIDIADAQREGTVQYPDFLYMLSGSRDTEDDDSEEQQAKNLPSVQPFGGVEVTAARNERNKRLRMEEELSAQTLADEERRVMEEIEQENIRVEMDILQTFPNPKVSERCIEFDFATETQVAQLVSTVKGAVARKKADFRISNLDSCLICNNAALRCSLRGLSKILSDAEVNRSNNSITEYTITTEFCLPLAATYDSNKRNEGILSHCQIDVLRWALPYYMFVNSGNCPQIEVSIRDQLRKKKRKEANAESSNENDEAQESDGDDDDDDETTAKERLTMIFKTSVPSVESFVGYLPISAAPRFQMSAVKRQSVIIQDNTYEYGELNDDRFPKGWICCRWGNDLRVQQLYARIGLESDKIVFTTDTEELPGPPFGRVQDSSVDPEKQARWGDWLQFFGDRDDDLFEEEEEEEEVAEEEAQCDDYGASSGTALKGRVQGDVEDLMIAIRKLRTLEKGDRVRRHPAHWGHGEEDGGEGSIGKVVSVKFDEVEVQWPNQNKTLCSWGKAGVFELVKCEKDTNPESQRKAETDDRHKETIELEMPKAKNRNACENCQARPPYSELYICNECQKPTYLCAKCFEDGMHDMHEFTEIAAFLRAKEEEKKAGKVEEEKAKEEESDDENMGDLFLFDDDEPRQKVTAKEEEKKPPVASAPAAPSAPIDPNIAPQEITDAVPRTSDSFNVGSWVRTEVRIPSAVKRNHLGIVVGNPSPTHCTVAFLCEPIGEKATVIKNALRVELVPVRPYIDPEFGGNTVESAKSIAKVATNHFSPNVWLLNEAAMQRAKFHVGDTVIATPDSEHHCVVAAVLPNRRYLLFATVSHLKFILSESALTKSYTPGTMVKFRRSVEYPHYGWPSCSPAQRYTVEGRVTGTGRYGAQSFSVDFKNYGKVDCIVTDIEEAREASWIIQRGNGSWTLLPSSCKIIIDRAHSSGKRLVRFTFSKKIYRVEFPSYTLYGEGLGGEDVAHGTLRRFPPIPWSRPQPPLLLDSGAWHLLTVVVSKNSVTAMCDGQWMPVEFAGPSSDIFMKQRRRTDLCLSFIRQQQNNKQKASRGPKGSIPVVDDSMLEGMNLFDDDFTAPNAQPSYTMPEAAPSVAPTATAAETGAEAEEEEEPVDPPHDGPTIAEMVPLYLGKPVLVFGTTSDVSDNNMKLVTFPQRLVTKQSIQWGPADAAAVTESHQKMLRETSWTCVECQHVNPRRYFVCDECNTPRKIANANRMLDKKSSTRFRYVMLRSKEATHLRTKLNNKLRALFQTQLDELMNPTGPREDDLSSVL